MSSTVRLLEVQRVVVLEMHGVVSSTVLLVEIKRVGCTGKALCCVKYCASG